jgi:DNA-binding transcriptional LysR family regulator
MIDKLEMFIVLAREAHFGRASEVIGISQPSLSAALRQIEDILGVTLVRRGSRYEGLTVEGERLLQWAQRIVADTRTMRAEFHNIRHGLSGRLRLGVIPTATARASELTLALLARHPALQICLKTLPADEILTRIEAMDLDAGLIYHGAQAPGFSQIPLYTERLLALLPAGHRLAAAPQLQWADLCEEPLCLLTANMRNRAIVWGHLAGAGRLLPPRVEADELLSLLYHVQTGQMVTVIPEAMAALAERIEGLSCRPLPGDGDRVSLVLAAREPRLPVLNELLGLARQKFATLD